VGAVHRYGEAPKTLDFDPFSAKFIRSYILKAKSFEPNLDQDMLPEIVNTYVNTRAAERVSTKDSHVDNLTNVRTLLGMLRLAQAHARLRFSNTVERGDFEEAVRLTLEAKQSVIESRNNRKNRGNNDDSSDVWGCIKSKLLIAGSDNFVMVADIEKFAMNQGYTQAQIKTALDAYESLSVINFNEERNRVCLFSSM
jgi:DNA replication licensing factor MCM7